LAAAVVALACVEVGVVEVEDELWVFDGESLAWAAPDWQ